MVEYFAGLPFLTVLGFGGSGGKRMARSALIPGSIRFPFGVLGLTDLVCVVAGFLKVFIL